MTYIYSFLFCGLICVIGEIILDKTKLTPGHITTLFVVLGVFLDTFDIYDNIINKVGGGALVPITSCGHSLAHSTAISTNEVGVIGLFKGMFDLTTPGIVAAIVFSFLFSLIFSPKD